MNSRVKDDLVQSLKSFLPFEVVNPNPSNRYDKLLTYIKESDVPDNVNLFYPDKLALVGNLGIGTRNPVRGLHLEGDSGTSAIRFKTTGGEWDFAPFWSAFDDGNFALNRVSGSGNLLIPSGNVGIGETNPSQLLHLSGAPATGGIRIDEESNTAYQAYLTFLDTSGNFGLDVNGGGRLRFATGGTENLTILSSGNVGIGVSNPTRNLTVSSPTNAVISVQNSAQSTEGVLNAPEGGTINVGTTGLYDLQLSTNNIEKMRITSDGSVGIATDSPATDFHLVARGSTYGIRVERKTLGYYTELRPSGLVNFQTHMDFDSVSHYIYKVNGNEKMRLTSDGNVGINQNNPTIKLEVVDTNNEILLLKQTDGPSSYMTIGPNNNTGAKIGYDNTDSADLVTIGHHTVGNVININSSGKVGIGETDPSDHHVAIREARKGNVISHGAIQVSSTATTIDDRVGIVFNQTDTISRGRAAIMATAEQNLGYGSGLSFFTRYAIDGTTLQTTDERMRITSAGNVGIGTDVPDTNLHISGSGNVAGKVVSTNASAVWVADSISTEASILSFTTAGVNAWKFQKAATTGNLEIRNSTDATKFSMVDSGNVGLSIVPAAGWSSTYTVLQIGQDVALWGAPSGAQAALSSNLYFDGSSYKYLNSTRAASQIYITGGQFGIQSAVSGTAGQPAALATRLHMTNAGRFFINAGALTTTDSTANLNIATGGSSGGLKLIGGFTPANGNDLGAITFAGNDSANNNVVGEASIIAKATAAHSGTTAPTALLFSTKPASLGPGSSPVERMRIDDEGRVGIGPSSDYDQGKIWASAHITDHNDNSVDRSKGLRFGTHEATLQSAGIACWNFNTGGSPYYRNLTFYATGWDGSSVLTRNIMTIGNYGGNVGIWEENPAYRLDIVHSANGATYPIRIGNRDTTAGTNQQVGMIFSLARNSGTILDAGLINVARSSDMTNDDVNIDTHMSFYTQNNYSLGERMRIDSVGNVSVNDAYNTNFVNNGSNTRYIGVAANNSDALFIAHCSGQGVGYFGYDYSADRLIIATDNGAGGNSIQFSVNAGITADGTADNLAAATAAMTINSSGNVGIGTNNMQGKLDVDGDLRVTANIASNTAYEMISLGSDRSIDDYGGLYKDYWRINVVTAGPDTTGASHHHGYGDLRFSGVTGANVTYEDRMTIRHNGSVIIGGPANFNYISKLTILHDPDTQFSDHISFLSPLQPDYVAGIRMEVSGTLAFYQAWNGNTAAYNPALSIDKFRRVLIGYTSSNGSYNLQVNSQIFATNSTIATSDGRYKEDIQTISNATDLVSRLNPVQFKWKSHSIHNFNVGETDVGFIAQEVQEVLSDTDYKDSIVVINQSDEEEFMGMSETKIIPLLTAALQEAISKIETLETKVAALEEISKQ